MTSADENPFTLIFKTSFFDHFIQPPSFSAIASCNDMPNKQLLALAIFQAGILQNEITKTSVPGPTLNKISSNEVRCLRHFPRLVTLGCNESWSKTLTAKVEGTQMSFHTGLYRKNFNTGFLLLCPQHSAKGNNSTHR